LNGAGAEAANFPEAQARSQTVRVSLTRLSTGDRLDITLDGIYSLGNRDENSMIFERGSELAILLQNGSLIVHYKGMSFNSGSSLYLTRYQAEDGRENGVRLTGEAALYEGDLLLNANDGLIRMVLSIHVEDYLYGVVPYEMSDDFPLEALKAQAVTARTYALRKQNAANAFDLVDTASDQVYRGRLSGHDRTSQAIRETKGLCGFYRGELAECFYSASNGGQTELVENVWSPGNYGYYTMVDDPYDLENPQSLVKTFHIPKKSSVPEDMGYGLRALLVKELESELAGMGYDPAPESLRVDEVLMVAAGTPAVISSRVMKMLTIQFKYSGRTRQDAPSAVQLVNTDDEEVSLYGITPSPHTPAPLAFELETVTPPPTPIPTPKPIYGEFERVDNAVTLHIPIFPAVMNAMALSLNGNMNNEIITVAEGKSSFRVESRRYGHGVGMSQRGAEWMAEEYAMSYLDILRFYYPGLEWMVFPQGDHPLPVLDTERMATLGPRPTPTPRPTLMPVTGEAKAGEWYAIVWDIADDSSLNLRAAPDMSGDIILRLSKNQRLLVQERCVEEGWVKVRTDVAEGYVMERFLKPD